MLCLNGRITVATTLERLTRIKNDSLMRHPFLGGGVDFNSLEKFHRLLNYLLDEVGLTLLEIDCVAWGGSHAVEARRFFLAVNPNIEFVEPPHHLAHACQAYLSSPFAKSAILILDGEGDPLSGHAGCLAYGEGNQITILRMLSAAESVGKMYAAFTEKIGFAPGEEGKTMGLAPYGQADVYEQLKVLHSDHRGEAAPLVQLPPYATWLKSLPRRNPTAPLTDLDRNLAFATQKITEEVMLTLADWLYEKTGSQHLCIAGGVGLNCVANYLVATRSPFSQVFIHPNPGNNGLAVGQALHVYNQRRGHPRTYVATSDALGRAYSEATVQEVLATVPEGAGICVQKYEDLSALYQRVASAIEGGKIVGWFQGKSEFGPRALGQRSLLADPRRADMKDALNSRVKFREDFRPFAPSVLAERAPEFFELPGESPFMLLAATVKPGMEARVPAITHVDNSARVQTVKREQNAPYYDLIAAFDELTGIPMLLDTSFNVAGEPIVETPEDAIRCFLSTSIDVLCIDRFYVEKS